MTDEAWDLLTKISAVQGMNRSEAIERLIRKAMEWSAPPAPIDAPN
jgi:hypothetical protein